MGSCPDGELSWWGCSPGEELPGGEYHPSCDVVQWGVVHTRLHIGLEFLVQLELRITVTVSYLLLS